jgi:hypothetical protein
MKLLIIFCIIIVSLDSCITPFDINLSDSSTTLIVDGMITDQPGPYTIKIFHSSDLDDQIERVNWFTGAAVFISDDNGTSEKLAEVTPGNYQTKINGIQGTVGRTYTVKIITQNENVYESLPEKLLPVGEFRNLYHEFEENISPEVENFLNPKNGFNIYVDAQVLPEQEGLVRWRTTQIFQIHTYPETKKKNVRGGDGAVVSVPDPPECSGWISTTRGLRNIGDCSCCECWITRFDEDPILSDKRFTSEGEITRNKILFLPAGRRFFYKKHFVKVEQMSISEASYQFWQDIKKQKAEGSNLFQTPPSKTTGNIIPKTNGAPSVLGIFSASSIRVKSFYITKEDIPYTIPSMDSIAAGCTQVYKSSSTIKPSFW